MAKYQPAIKDVAWKRGENQLIVKNVDWKNDRQKKLLCLKFGSWFPVGRLYSRLLEDPEDYMERLNIGEDEYMGLVMTCEKHMTEPQIKYSQDMATAREARNKHYKNIMEFESVTDTRIGLKKVGGKFTDEIAICIGVKKKKPLKNIPKNQRIPLEYDGVKTDVLEEGFVFPVSV